MPKLGAEFPPSKGNVAPEGAPPGNRSTTKAKGAGCSPGSGREAGTVTTEAGQSGANLTQQRYRQGECGFQPQSPQGWLPPLLPSPTAAKGTAAQEVTVIGLRCHWKMVHTLPISLSPHGRPWEVTPTLLQATRSPRFTCLHKSSY